MIRSITALAFLCVFVFSGLQARAQSQAKTGVTDSAQPTGEDGFVAMDPTKRPTVSGKNLLIGAYSVILAVFLLYTVSLVRRERSLQKAAADLSERARGPSSS